MVRKAKWRLIGGTIGTAAGGALGGGGAGQVEALAATPVMEEEITRRK